MEDLPLVGEDFDVYLIRLLIALLLSGLIGFERELKNHSAGFRTHILVGVGSCLMMLLSLYGFQSFIQAYDNIRFDPARIPSYVISGIGFLGAGTIIVNGMTIKGLTTAASIWTVAGLGLVIGAGMYDAAILTTILVLLSLVLLNQIEEKVMAGRNKNYLRLVVERDVNMGELLRTFEEVGINIRKLSIENERTGERILFIELEKGQKFDQAILFDQLSKVEHVKLVYERK
ncbi:MgtC/SapB family protein [Thalassobacillus pellis]|uniref:MgtC/SapB family protein n=1 Tax=Thalassobacillus pellis TaxID=748008 RepID=UPI0019606B3F|nr:MgtC/SapB family protein [Thalassobacillus pellis]MBM7555121.1 putative Mg2+ transporter-C (MgtC) family protein [Thalassobacillus pellis]